MNYPDNLQVKSDKEFILDRIEKIIQTQNFDSVILSKKSIEELADEVSVYHQELVYQNEELLFQKQQIEETRKLYQELFDHAPIGYVILNEDYEICAVNKTFAELMNSDAFSLKHKKFYQLIHPDSQNEFYLSMRQLDREGHCELAELKLGSLVFCLKCNQSTVSGQKSIRCACVDITQNKLVEELQEKNRLIESILDHAPMGIWMIGQSPASVFSNRFVNEHFDLTEEEIKICNLTDQKVLASKEIKHCTETVTFKDGKKHILETIKIPVKTGINGDYSVLGLGIDITDRVLHEEQLRQAAIRDNLTGLFNRHYFDSIVDEQMACSDQNCEPLSMVLLDLDHFKEVNDTWGHPVGDELLKITAEAIGKVIRETDVFSRFGGEEFVVLMPGTSLDGAVQAAEKIRAAVEGLSFADIGIRTVSLGVAERMNSETFSHWYQRLDGALYKAKQTGRNRVVISKS